jgi:hypothetical protein
MQGTADVFSLDNKTLLHKDTPADVPANGVVTATHLDLAPLEKDAVILAKLELKDQSGKVVSSNLYWLAGESQDFRQLTRLAAPAVTATASAKLDGANMRIQVELKNTGDDVALQNKLTLIGSSDGRRILPAYYSDNYVSLLPGETRHIEVEYPVSAAGSAAPAFTLRGFNLPQQTVPVAVGR